MGDITLRDLHDVRTAITADVRHEVERMEKGVHARIDEMKATQATHGDRLDQQGRDLGALRAVVEERTKPGSSGLELTPRQKKVLWTAAVAVGGACVEGARHLAGWVMAAFSHGVQAR